MTTPSISATGGSRGGPGHGGQYRGAGIELGSDVTQNAARSIDRSCRADLAFISKLRNIQSITNARVDNLIAVGVKYLVAGAPDATEGIVHRLDKFDTKKGISSIQSFLGPIKSRYRFLMRRRRTSCVRFKKALSGRSLWCPSKWASRSACRTAHFPPSGAGSRAREVARQWTDQLRTGNRHDFRTLRDSDHDAIVLRSHTFSGTVTPNPTAYTGSGVA